MSDPQEIGYRIGYRAGMISAVLMCVVAVLTGIGLIVAVWIYTDPSPTADTACPVPTRNSYNFPPEVRPR